jgi:hypothetical protein
MKDREDLREVPQEQAREFARKNNVAFFLETSAKTGENVQQVFLLASKLLYQNNKEIISDMVSLHISLISLETETTRYETN